VEASRAERSRSLSRGEEENLEEDNEDVEEEEM
jgi:hypothetical protein